MQSAKLTTINTLCKILTNWMIKTDNHFKTLQNIVVIIIDFWISTIILNPHSIN